MTNGMSDLEKIIKKYAAFEKKVMKLISRRLGKYCDECAGGCCTATICRETIESPFLIRLRKTVQPDIRYQKVTGWQRSKGCALIVARPPICHEFTCNEIDKASDPVERYVIKVLCRLITHMGKKADGVLHLVEVDTDDDLEQDVTLKRFTARLREAEEAFKVVKSFFSVKCIVPEAVPVLSRIHPLPPSFRGKNRKKLMCGL